MIIRRTSVLLAVIFIFSCNPYIKNNITGEYYAQKKQTKKNIREEIKFKFMQNNKFYYSEKFGSLGWNESGGTWKMNKNNIILNSTYQIDSGFFFIKENFNKINDPKRIISFHVVYGDEYLNYPANSGVLIYLNSDKSKPVKLDINGKGLCSKSEINKISIFFKRYNREYNYIPVNKNTNDFTIFYNKIDFDNYLIFDNAILKIEKRKLIMKNNGKKYIFRKQKTD